MNKQSRRGQLSRQWRLFGVPYLTAGLSIRKPPANIRAALDAVLSLTDGLEVISEHSVQHAQGHRRFHQHQHLRLSPIAPL
jgi:hypothetical protein